MEKADVLNAVESARANSKQRKFKQSFDLIITLKDINIKNPEEKPDFFMQLPKSKGKKTKVCALVGTELYEQAKKVCDTTIGVDDFPKYQQDKKIVKKLADEHDYFVAQATIMPKVATTFGKALGPKGKMPNPKAGCVVPPNANMKAIYDKLQQTARIVAKNSPMVQAKVGSEDMSSEDVAENILSVYTHTMHHLPQEKNNIKQSFLKLTMGKPVKIGDKTETTEEAPVHKKKKAAPKKEESAAEKAPAEEGQ